MTCDLSAALSGVVRGDGKHLIRIHLGSLGNEIWLLSSCSKA